jgi:hypothetical protein
LAANAITVTFDRSGKSRQIHIERTPTVTPGPEPPPNPLTSKPDPQDPPPSETFHPTVTVDCHPDPVDCHPDPVGRTPISANSTCFGLATSGQMKPSAYLTGGVHPRNPCSSVFICVPLLFLAKFLSLPAPKNKRTQINTDQHRCRKPLAERVRVDPRSAVDAPVGLPGSKTSHRFPPQPRGRAPAVQKRKIACLSKAFSSQSQKQSISTSEFRRRPNHVLRLLISQWRPQVLNRLPGR